MAEKKESPTTPGQILHPSGVLADGVHFPYVEETDKDGNALKDDSGRVKRPIVQFPTKNVKRAMANDWFRPVPPIPAK